MKWSDHFNSSFPQAPNDPNENAKVNYKFPNLTIVSKSSNVSLQRKRNIIVFFIFCKYRFDSYSVSGTILDSKHYKKKLEQKMKINLMPRYYFFHVFLEIFPLWFLKTDFNHSRFY